MRLVEANFYSRCQIVVSLAENGDGVVNTRAKHSAQLGPTIRSAIGLDRYGSYSTATLDNQSTGAAMTAAVAHETQRMHFSKELAVVSCGA